MAQGSTPQLDVFQIKKFIKMKPRRLISGLLHINVVSHVNHDGGPDGTSGTDYDDFMQSVHDGEPHTNVQKSSSFSRNGTHFSDPSDHGDGTDRMYHNRQNFFQSFADYDSLLFYVCGGMALSGGMIPPHEDYEIDNFPPTSGLQNSAGGLVDGFYHIRFNNLGVAHWSSDNGVTGDGGIVTAADANATWFTRMHGETCCHMLKSHLLSRINNASGHKESWDDTNTDDTYYFKHRPIFTYKYTQIPNDEDRNQSHAAGLTREAVLSHGIYHNEESDTTALTYRELTKPPGGYKDGIGANDLPYTYPPDLGQVEPSDPSGNPYNWEETGQNAAGNQYDSDPNTYYNPVDTVRIYGTHNVVIDSKLTANDNTHESHTVYSSGSTNAHHEDDFWDLVIDIGLRGSKGSLKAIMQSQINVSFQPFGETREYVLSNTAHT